MSIACAERDFILHKADELLHLSVHVFHALAHLQNNGNPGNVHAQVTGKIQDELQPLQIFFGIKACVAVRARGLQHTSFKVGLDSYLNFVAQALLPVLNEYS
jgi:hypothetical protein